MPGDLASGHYPPTDEYTRLFGFNASQGNQSARSNARWLGLSGMSDGALAGTGVGCAVAVPVHGGDVISKITVYVGATAEATGTHAWAALYSGLATPALLSQSADNTGAAALAASGAFTFTLQASQIITALNAPNGFVYASIMVAGGTIPTAMGVGTPVAVGYQLNSTAPLFFAATHGSALTTTAPATIASPSAKAVTPVVVLT